MEAPRTDTAIPGAFDTGGVTPTEDDAGRLPWVRTIGGIWLPAFMVVAVLFLCFVWPLIGPVPPPTGGTILNSNLPSGTPGHVLGTDATGNDEWSRLLYGGQASLEVAMAVTAIGLVIGGLLGAFAGYVGGWRDDVIMRILDVLIAFPPLALAVAIAEPLGP